MTYQEAVSYILDIPKFTKKNGPAHTAELMELLGNPQEKFAYIHVAGSNGKGSVCAYLEQVLLESGISMGMFTSPHLVDIRERFRVQGKQCTREQFLESFERVRQVVEEMEKQGSAHPTFFEYVYAMAMVLFEKAGVKCALVETGLGGRLDATNVIKRPVLEIITSISLEHTEILGDTIEQIAWEKAGILKPGVPVVFDGNDCKAAQVILGRGKELSAPAVGISEDSVNILLKDGKTIDFSLDCEYDVKRIQIAATAEYQARNAALALAAVNQLMELSRGGLREYQLFSKITPEQVCRGFACAHWPGRMEEIQPEVYLDGAHNPAGINAFLEGVESLAERPSILLFSMVKEKNFREALARIREQDCWEEIIFTELVGNPRALPAQVLLGAFEEPCSPKAQGEEAPRLLAISDIRQAYGTALAHKKPGQKVFCTGSLYFVGEIMALQEE